MLSSSGKYVDSEYQDHYYESRDTHWNPPRNLVEKSGRQIRKQGRYVYEPSGYERRSE